MFAVLLLYIFAILSLSGSRYIFLYSVMADMILVTVYVSCTLKQLDRLTIHMHRFCNALWYGWHKAVDAASWTIMPVKLSQIITQWGQASCPMVHR